MNMCIHPQEEAPLLTSLEYKIVMNTDNDKYLFTVLFDVNHKTLGYIYDKDTAELIVCKVNNHAALVEALKYATEWLSRIDPEEAGSRMPDSNKSLHYLKAALAAAGETK